MKLEAITLPAPKTEGPMALEAAIAARRSVRTFEPYDVSLEEISQLLWAAQGITGQQDHKRAAGTKRDVLAGEGLEGIVQVGFGDSVPPALDGIRTIRGVVAPSQQDSQDKRHDE